MFNYVRKPTTDQERGIVLRLLLIKFIQCYTDIDAVTALCWCYLIVGHGPFIYDCGLLTNL